MRHLVVLCALTCAIGASDALAQFRANFGVRTGFTAMSLHDSDINFAGRVGYLIGPTFRFQAIGPFDIQAEAVFNQKGATFRGRDGRSVLTGRYEAMFVDVPLMARIEFNREATLSPSLVLGPYTSFNLWERIQEDGFRDTREVTFRSFDAGIVIGFGVDLDAQITTLQAELRHAFGFVPMLEIDGVRHGRHSALQMIFGLTF
jgi:hypothetical protein